MPTPQEAADRHEHELRRRANVVGVGDGGDRVVVLVTRKVPASALSTDDLVPEEIDGVPTDVVEVGDVRPMLAPGTSIGLADSSGGTGTAGAVVVDAGPAKRFYLLTNNHVAANTNRAPMLAAIASPGPADGLGGVIGRLARAEPIYFDRLNYVDCALVHVDADVAREGLGAIRARTITPRVGWYVQKTGRTTGHNEGTVVALNATIEVNYGSAGVAEFRGQVVTTHMLDPGDSGSVLASRSGLACALGFAGSDRASFHNPIGHVLDALSVRFPRP